MHPKIKPIADTYGFTLLELMLAISLLAIISAGSYRLLSSTIAAADGATKLRQRIEEKQLLLWLFRSDLNSFANPLANIEKPEPRLALEGGPRPKLQVAMREELSSVFFQRTPVIYTITTSAEQTPELALVRNMQSTAQDIYGESQLDIGSNKVVAATIQVTDTRGNVYADWPPTLPPPNPDSPQVEPVANFVSIKLDLADNKTLELAVRVK